MKISEYKNLDQLKELSDYIQKELNVSQEDEMYLEQYAQNFWGEKYFEMTKEELAQELKIAISSGLSVDGLKKLGIM